MRVVCQQPACLHDSQAGIQNSKQIYKQIQAHTHTRARVYVHRLGKTEKERERASKRDKMKHENLAISSFLIFGKEIKIYLIKNPFDEGILYVGGRLLVSRLFLHCFVRFR